MATREIHLELLLGKRVLDPAGQPVGRIEEMRARKQNNEWVVTEYLIGPAALLERLSAWGIGMAVLRLLGARHGHVGHKIPWDKLDLSDPDQPRLLCTLDECEALTAQPQEKDWFSSQGSGVEVEA